MLTNKIYNCIITLHKITPYKLFNTEFNIGFNAFLTRAQPFHVNVGVMGRMGILRATKFFPIDTVRDNWLVRREEFVQDNITNWGDLGLVSWGKLSATKRSLSYEPHLTIVYVLWLDYHENKFIYFLIYCAELKITLFIFCIIESGQETKDIQFVVSVVILSCVIKSRVNGLNLEAFLKQTKAFLNHPLHLHKRL